MAKLVKLFTYVFAFVGVLVTAGGGYVYATNSELVNEFWSVKDDFRQVAPERRKEVIAELPARVTFEREVGAEMAVLPEERQKELYEQLAKSRDAVFDNFKKRIKAEADITKATKDKAEAAKEIINKLGKVNVSVDMGSRKTEAPKDSLAGVMAARDKLDAAVANFGEVRDTSSDTKKRVAAAVDGLKALDKLGDEVVKARGSSLSSDDKSRLSGVIASAKESFQMFKATPGLDADSSAKPLLASIPKKLNG
jgi:uncharacterized protein YhaN